MYTEESGITLLYCIVLYCIVLYIVYAARLFCHFLYAIVLRRFILIGTVLSIVGNGAGGRHRLAMFREMYVSFVQLEDCGDPDEFYFNNSRLPSPSSDAITRCNIT